MKDDRQVYFQENCCCIRPCNGSHFIAGIVSDTPMKLSSRLRRKHRQMACFMQNVSRISQPGFVNPKFPMTDVQPAQEAILRKYVRLYSQAYAGEQSGHPIYY